MKQIHALLLVVIIAGLLVSACAPKLEAAAPVPLVRVEHLTGAQPTRITLTADGIKRLDLQTGIVRLKQVKGTEQTVIPYSSIVYDTQGQTWVYTSPEVGTYLRTSVQVENIDGDDAYITEGLPAGTAIVTVGAEELFGSETEFEEE